jgi:PAS domain S-box-containing protein
MIADDKKTLDEGYRKIVETVPDKYGKNHIYQTRKFRIKRSGKPPLLGGISLDITEQRQAENALLANAKEYRETLKDLIVGVVVHSSDTSILFSNPAASNILGLTQEQLSGKKAIDPSWKFVYEDSSIMKVEAYPATKVFSTKKPLQDYVVGVIRPDRDYITWVLVNAIPVSSNNNELEKVVVNFVDITEHKQVEKLRLEQKKFQGVLEMAGAICHEMSQPMQIVSGFSEILLIDMENSDPKYKSLKSIEAGINRMSQLMRKITRITHYESKPYLKNKIVDIEQASQHGKEELNQDQ